MSSRHLLPGSISRCVRRARMRAARFCSIPVSALAARWVAGTSPAMTSVGGVAVRARHCVLLRSRTTRGARRAGNAWVARMPYSRSSDPGPALLRPGTQKWESEAFRSVPVSALAARWVAGTSPAMTSVGGVAVRARHCVLLRSRTTRGAQRAGIAWVRLCAYSRPSDPGSVPALARASAGDAEQKFVRPATEACSTRSRRRRSEGRASTRSPHPDPQRHPHARRHPHEGGDPRAVPLVGCSWVLVSAGMTLNLLSCHATPIVRGAF